MNDLLDLQVKMLRGSDWLVAAGIVTVALPLLFLLRSAALRHAHRFAQRTRTDVDDLVTFVLERTRWYFLLAFSIAIAVRAVTLPPTAERLAHDATVVALFLQAAVWGTAALSFWRLRYVASRTAGDSGSIATAAAVDFFVRLLLWGVLLLLALENLGVRITALVAGLGITGLAVALAVQGVLGDLLAAIFIVLDRPFAAGDMVHVDQFRGTVEHIGVRTTRLRSVEGEEVIFANGDITRARVRNLSRMQRRRAVLAVGVGSETSEERIAELPALVRSVIDPEERAGFDHASLRSYADGTLEFEVEYHITTPKLDDYRHVQQTVTLGLQRSCKARGIELKYIRPLP